MGGELGHQAQQLLDIVRRALDRDLHARGIPTRRVSVDHDVAVFDASLVTVGGDALPALAQRGHDRFAFGVHGDLPVSVGSVLWGRCMSGRREMRVAVLDAPVEGAAVIGDIHGCAALLEKLLDRIGPEREIFFVGDLIDRGPDAPRVLDVLIERGARGVLGNHELWFRDWLSGVEVDPFVLRPFFGAAETLRAYDLPPTRETLRRGGRWVVPAAHRELVTSLPDVLGITVGSQPWWIVHAGIPAVRADPPSELRECVQLFGDQLLWGTTPVTERPQIDRPVIIGHLPQTQAIDLGHLVAIDTGAGTRPDGYLSALLLPERELVQSDVAPP